MSPSNNGRRQRRVRTHFTELKRVFDVLHSPRGCPWDKKQTYRTLLPYLREEADELERAVRRRDFQNLREEIGDILLQVMFLAKIAEKERRFGIEDVIDTLIRKLKRRHPHVFGTVRVSSAAEVVANWHAIKKMEKRDTRDHGRRR